MDMGGDLCASNVLCPPLPAQYHDKSWFGHPDSRAYVPTLDGGAAGLGTWAHIAENPWSSKHRCDTYRRMHGGYWGSGDSTSHHWHKGYLPCCFGKGFGPELIVDGRYTSAWRSADDAGLDGKPVTIMLDIRRSAQQSAPSGTQVVRQVSLEWEDNYFAQEYTVDFSVDGATWTTVVDNARGSAATVQHDVRSPQFPMGRSVRYVRVTLSSPAMPSSIGGALYRLRNVRLYGHASSVSVVRVEAGAAGSFQYQAGVSPVVERVSAHGRSPARGTTAGNTRLTIVGSGFTAAATVMVGDMDCPVQSGSNSTHVFCLTPAVALTEGGARRVSVSVPGVGASLPHAAATFTYVDLWSSRTTWGGSEPPVGCGDFEHDRECVDSVIIPEGQVIMLDVTPPRFFLILVQGTLVFDPDAPELELRATYLLVHGGKLQIGTPDEPHQGKATITLFGHFGNRELPSFGAKVLACYKCTMDLHGVQHERAWSRLSQRAYPGDQSITLEHSVSTWPVGVGLSSQRRSTTRRRMRFDRSSRSVPMAGR